MRLWVSNSSYNNLHEALRLREILVLQVLLPFFVCFFFASLHCIFNAGRNQFMKSSTEIKRLDKIKQIRTIANFINWTSACIQQKKIFSIYVFRILNISSNIGQGHKRNPDDSKMSFLFLDSTFPFVRVELIRKTARCPKNNFVTLS